LVAIWVKNFDVSHSLFAPNPLANSDCHEGLRLPIFMQRQPKNFMQITDFHAKYYALALSRRFGSDDPNKLTSALGDAQVDLNPHQIEAG